MSKLWIMILCLLLFSNYILIAQEKTNDMEENIIKAKMIGFVDLPCEARDCFVKGNYCYIAGGYGGIVIADITDPQKPKVVSQLKIKGFAWKIEIFDDIVIVAAHDAGIYTYKLEKANKLTKLSQFKTKGYCYDFAVKDNFVYIADGKNGLSVLDISDITAPRLTSCFPCQDKAYDISITNNRVYVACGLEGLQIYDISEPTKIKLLNTYKSEHVVLDVESVENFAFISDKAVGVISLDVTDPLKIKKNNVITLHDLQNPWVDGEIRGKYLFGACLYGGLEIIDISDPANLKYYGRSNTTGPTGSDYARSFGVEINGEYAYMSTYYAPRKYRGLQILKLDNSLIAKDNNTLLSIKPVKEPDNNSFSINFEKLVKKNQTAIDKAAKQSGIERNVLTYNIGNLGGEKYRLDAINEIFKNPFSMSKYAGDISKQYSGTDNICDIMKLAFNQHGKWNDKYDLENEFNVDVNIEKSIEKLFALDNKKLNEEKLSYIQKKVEPLSAEIREVLNTLIIGVSKAIEHKRTAFKNLNKEDWKILQSVKQNIYFNQKQYTDILINKVDFKSLAKGALVLAFAVNKANVKLEKISKLSVYPDMYFNLDTPFGKIIVSGTNDDLHKEDALLLLDFGGDDIYVNKTGSSESSSSGVAVSIDCSGNDTYINNQDFTQGSGVFGIGMLIDLSGNDVYNKSGAKTSFSQGAAIVGVGLLFDGGGNDKYFSFAFSQGAAHIGLGILYDKSGSDQYSSVQASQGFGSNLGLGVLLEGAGDDSYIAVDINPDTIRDKTSFSSFCQGAAQGNREVFSKEPDKCIGMSGGIGMLLDVFGNDTYFAGGFAQGTAYWDAFGLLIDIHGDDTYKAIEYAQGGAVHFAASGHFDWSGNDKYQNLNMVNLGASKDFSIGIHVDTDGNDNYQSYDWSIGSVQGGGIGLFVDHSGNDIYTLFSRYPGSSNFNAYGGVERHAGKLSAIFIDLNGDDKYMTSSKSSTPAKSGNNLIWRQGKNSIAIDGK